MHYVVDPTKVESAGTPILGSLPGLWGSYSPQTVPCARGVLCPSGPLSSDVLCLWVYCQCLWGAAVPRGCSVPGGYLFDVFTVPLGRYVPSRHYPVPGSPSLGAPVSLRAPLSPRRHHCVPRALLSRGLPGRAVLGRGPSREVALWSLGCSRVPAGPSPLGSR